MGIMNTTVERNHGLWLETLIVSALKRRSGGMKVTEESIDYNAVRIIKEIIGEPYEYIESKDMVVSVLCEVKGGVEMADAMKEVLKV